MAAARIVEIPRIRAGGQLRVRSGVGRERHIGRTAGDVYGSRLGAEALGIKRSVVRAAGGALRLFGDWPASQIGRSEGSATAIGTDASAVAASALANMRAMRRDAIAFIGGRFCGVAAKYQEEGVFISVLRRSAVQAAAMAGSAAWWHFCSARH